MDDFLKYFENERFVRWAYHSDPETEAYWEEYFLNYPDERKNAETARLILSQLKPKEDRGNKVDIYDLFATIIQKIDRQNRISKSRKIWVSFAKYAAVAVVFLFVGILWRNLSDQSSYSPRINDQFVDFFLQNGNDARLILPDGQNIAIREKESNVELRKDGRIIINRHDTLKVRSNSSFPEINQLVVPYGKNSSIKLPDGTIAFLNAGSRLVYPSFFEGNNRKVHLEGEGFFEVFHNLSMPFIVETDDLNVEALGTCFNVTAYPVDKNTEVVLVEGKVRLRENAFSLLKKKQVLSPGELALFNRETINTSIHKVNVEDYVAWHKGYMNFENTDVTRIIIKLERYYAITIRLQDPKVGMRKITGKLKLKEEKDKVLNVLASTASVELIKIDEQNYVLK